MAGTFVVNGPNITIKFEYITLTANAISIVGDCAHYLWDVGYGNHGTIEEPILFEDLTNQQKLNIVDAHIKRVMIDASNTYKSVVAQEAAREAEAANEYDL